MAPTASAYFDPLAGGAVCRRCRPGLRRPFVFSARARVAMAELAVESLTSALGVRLAPEVQREIRALLGQYFSGLMGRRPKTLDLLIAATTHARAPGDRGDSSD